MVILSTTEFLSEFAELSGGHHWNSDSMRMFLKHCKLDPDCGFSDLDLKFHEMIAEASGNNRLNDEIKRYRLLVRAFCRITGNRLNLMDALDEHLKILNSIKSRNVKAAANAMSSHIDARRDAVLKEFCS